MIRKIQTTIGDTKKRSVEYDLNPAFERCQQSHHAHQKVTQLSVCSSPIGSHQRDEILETKGLQLPIKEATECPINDRTTINDGHSSPSAQSNEKRRRRSRHCPRDFKLTPELLTWAQGKTTLDEKTIRHETEKFRDWEFKDSKSDWSAAWRNWIRKADEYYQDRHPENSGQGPGSARAGNRVSRDRGLRGYLATLTREDAET